MKLERLIAIIFKLLNHEILSATELSEEFQVSTRTIYRDIEAIGAAGIPVVSHQGTNGGFGIIEGYKFDKSLLGSSDIAHLVSMLASLSSLFQDKDLQQTVERLRVLDAKRSSEALAIDLDTRTEPRSMIALRQAIHNQKRLRFDYVNGKNEFTSREIEPLRLQYKFHTWYVYGYCMERRDYREFKVSRMMKITVTDSTFLQRHQQPKETAPAADKGGFEDITLSVQPDSLAAVLDQLQSAAEKVNDDGTMTFTLAVYRPLEAGWLLSLLLGFGAGVKVVHPPALQQAVAAEAKKIMNVYKDV